MATAQENRDCLEGIRTCRWSEPFAQYDMTTAYHCLHPLATKEIEESNGELVSCYCLGLVDLCPYYEMLQKG